MQHLAERAAHQVHVHPAGIAVVSAIVILMVASAVLMNSTVIPDTIAQLMAHVLC